MTPGTVDKVYFDPKGGNSIVIKSPDGITTYYAHCDTTNVQPGDAVDSDTVIGTVGNTGDVHAQSTGPHIHLQVWNNGQLVDPSTYFTTPPVNHSSTGTS